MNITMRTYIMFQKDICRV